MRIRVLHVVETIKSGGVENRRLTLAKLLDKNFFEQKIVCTRAIGQLPVKLAEAGMEVIPIGPFKGPLHIKGYIKLLHIIKQYKPHIIHGAVFEGVTLAAVAGTMGRVPVVILEETSDPQNRSRRASLLLRLLAVFAKAVVAVSPSVEEYLLKKAKIPAYKIKLINNGISFPPQPDAAVVAQAKKIAGINDGDFVIGSVGRLRDYHKRFSDLIRAMAILKQKGISNIKLLIVGDGDDKAMLEALAVNLGVESEIIFTGYTSDTSVYYAMMDVFAIASFMEAFGLVATEAMYFKLPVVATGVGGLKHIVLYQQTGVLVNKEAPGELAEAFEMLYHDPAKRLAYGVAGYERVLKEYSAQAYVNNVTALYNSFKFNKPD
jgi:glycosyltransferase involved in cell wall biosynthesis